MIVDLDELLSRLDLPTKIRLLTGADDPEAAAKEVTRLVGVALAGSPACPVVI